MDPGEQITGTRDERYNLIAVLYHALHGAENCELYAADAEVAGREELAAFFLEAQAEQIELAERAKELLGIGGVAPGAATEGVPVDTVPGDIPPEGMTTPLDTAPPTDVVPPPETPRTDAPAEGPTVGRDVPPDTTPEDSPLRSADVQREEQVRADQVSVPTERPIGDVPPQAGDLRTEATAPSDVDTAPPERAEVSPEAPRAEEVPPRTADVPPGDEPPEDERDTTASSRQYFGDMIRESDRRSRGEL